MTILLAVLVIELISYALFSSLTNSSFSYGALRAERTAIRQAYENKYSDIADPGANRPPANARTNLQLLLRSYREGGPHDIPPEFRFTADRQQWVLYAHSPNHMEISVPAWATSITFQFGFMPASYKIPSDPPAALDMDKNADGAEFIVKGIAQDGTERLLFSRHLDPVHEPGDQGAHSAEVAMEPAQYRRIQFITDSSKTGKTNYDHTYWSEIVFGGWTSDDHTEMPTSNIAAHPFTGNSMTPGLILDLASGTESGEHKSYFPRQQCYVDNNGIVTDSEESILKRSDDTFIVVITGGSVANQFYCTSKDTLLDGLRSLPAAQGRTLRSLCLGYFTHKQPQQLTSLCYYLARGGEYDLLIDISGYNESVLPERLSLIGIHPSYPWDWNYIVKQLSPQEQQMVGRLMSVKTGQYRTAGIFQWLTPLVTANLVWRSLDGRYVAKAADIDAQLRELGHAIIYDYPVAGPQEDMPDLAKYTADLWYASERQMARISTVNHARYMSVLQPNPLLRGTKTLTERELRFVDWHTVSQVIGETYRHMSRLGPRLQQDNAVYLDLTNMFIDVAETRFTDAGSHLTPEGYREMAEAIVAGLNTVPVKKKIE